MPTITTATESDADLDRQVENVLAALTPAARTMLAGLGVGDAMLSRSLLQAMPVGTAAVLETRGVLTSNRQLTVLGEEVANALAYEGGLAAKPSLRSEVKDELLGRLRLIQLQKAGR